jgi:hypothetical protein
MAQGVIEQATPEIHLNSSIAKKAVQKHRVPIYVTSKELDSKSYEEEAQFVEFGISLNCYAHQVRFWILRRVHLLCELPQAFLD